MRKLLILVFVLSTLFTLCKKKPDEQQFTNEQIEQAYQKIKPKIDAILLAETFVGFEAIAKECTNMEEVKNVEVLGKSLIIEFQNGEIRGWIKTPKDEHSKNSKQVFLPGNSLFKQFSNSKGALKVCLINQQYNDENRLFNRDSVNNLYQRFSDRGWEVTIINGEEATLNFHRNDLNKYDVIYEITHGCASSSTTWILTGQSSQGILTSPQGTARFRVEELRNNEWVIVEYMGFSDRFIKDSYSGNSFNNSLIYLTACQALKYREQLAKTFIDKGVKVVVGWDESNCIGKRTGPVLLTNLLNSGDNLTDVINRLPNDMKSEEHGDYHPLTNLTIYPPTAGTYKLPTEAPEPSLKITSPSYGAIYHCGEWVDIFVSGYSGSDWRENLEVQISCLVGEPQHTISPEPCIYLCNQPALDRIEAPYSFTFSPESPEKWNGRWARLIAHDKKNNIWSNPQYIKVAPINDDINGVVINGIRWATRNVDMPGTFAAKPESAGMFYQWNRKVGWSNTDPMTSSNGGTTWDNNIPYSTIWEKTNDPCPTGWRVPTKEELESLVNANSHWIIVNGINGRIFGDGNQKVFFSAAGVRMGGYGGMLADVGNGGIAWSSTSCDDAIAYRMGFTNEGAAMNGCNHGGGAYGQGFSVRCVKE